MTLQIRVLQTPPGGVCNSPEFNKVAACRVKVNFLSLEFEGAAIVAKQSLLLQTLSLLLSLKEITLVDSQTLINQTICLIYQV